MASNLKFSKAPDSLTRSLLQNNSINESSKRASERNNRKLSTVSVEDEEIIERSQSMYRPDRNDSIVGEQFYPEFNSVEIKGSEFGEHSDKFINFTEIETNVQDKVQILSLINLAAYMLELTVLGIIIWMNLEGNIFALDNLQTPLLLNPNLKDAMWVTVFLLKGAFVFLPLINSQESFNEIVIIKIGYSF